MSRSTPRRHFKLSINLTTRLKVFSQWMRQPSKLRCCCAPNWHQSFNRMTFKRYLKFTIISFWSNLISREANGLEGRNKSRYQWDRWQIIARVDKPSSWETFSKNWSRKPRLRVDPSYLSCSLKATSMPETVSKNRFWLPRMKTEWITLDSEMVKNPVYLLTKTRINHEKF